MRPGCLATQPVRVVTSGDEQNGGGIKPHAVKGQEARSALGDKGAQQRVEAADLILKPAGSPAQLAQRDAGGVADDIARSVRNAAVSATNAAVEWRAKRARRSSGAVATSARI
jgi:hypothetical protein